MVMSEQYDVIVIGAGIAGLSTAANITEGNVLIIEKDKIITQERRYLRSTFLKSMDRFALSNCILTKYNVLSFRSITGSKFDFHFDDFEILLLDLGRINGTLKKHIEKMQEIKEEVEVVDVKQDNHKIEVVISENNNIETIHAKYLVDASGNSFFTRKKFNLRSFHLLCTCLGATFKNGYKGEPNVITIILPTAQFKCGGWIYPFDTKDYSFGIADILEDVGAPATILNEQFKQVQKHPLLEEIIQNGFEQNWDIGIIPVGSSHPLVFGRICYIGDVVGQATPWFIDGVRPILESSIMCANAINLALKQDDKSSLNIYQTNWGSTYGEVYNDYNHWEKWTKPVGALEETSVRHMLNEFKNGQTHLLDHLRYYDMSESGRDYLRNLRPQFCQNRR